MVGGCVPSYTGRVYIQVRLLRISVLSNYTYIITLIIFDKFSQNRYGMLCIIHVYTTRLTKHSLMHMHIYY